MRTLLKIAAVIAPPLVVVFIGNRRDKLISFALTACAYIPGSIHALSVVCREYPMKAALAITILLVLSPSASAQDFSFRRETRFWYYESVPYDYGYYRRPLVFPNYRYQAYPIQQQFYPMNWGAIPGYQTNGYFVPGVYGW